jgi:hypothetical protein
MPTSATVIDTDKGLNRAVANIKKLGASTLKVGIMGDESNQGTSVVDYGMYNEFGTRHIPARPFMGTTADRYTDELQKFAQFMAGRIVDGTMSAEQFLQILGQWYVAKTKQTIKEATSWAAPDSAATIHAKGSSSPLIDTGRLINAINYEVQAR